MADLLPQPRTWVLHNREVSLVQACAEVGVIIERARSLFAVDPQPAGSTTAEHLATAATTAATWGQTTDALAGELVTRHRGFADRSAAVLARAADTDTALASHAATAAELTRSGAARLAMVAREHDATSRAAGTATTSGAQQVILTALRSQVDRTAQIVDETRTRATELAGQVGLLDYPLDTPPAVPGPASPDHQPESTLDGIHGTGSRDMPIITKPGDLGPSNTGMFPGGTNWVEAIPGSGVWIPQDQIGGKLWMPSHPGDLAPPNYEEIAPGIWWPQPPSIDPPMDHPSYRG